MTNKFLNVGTEVRWRCLSAIFTAPNELLKLVIQQEANPNMKGFTH